MRSKTLDRVVKCDARLEGEGSQSQKSGSQAYGFCHWVNQFDASYESADAGKREDWRRGRIDRPYTFKVLGDNLESGSQVANDPIDSALLSREAVDC